MKPFRWSMVAAGAVLLVDQLTKWWAAATLPARPITVIDGFLELRYVTNSGVSFSMLEGLGSVIAFLVIAIVVFLVLLLRRIDRVPEAVALGLILGGALGNLSDRIFRGPGLVDGEVVDFIDFSFFPAFNVADAAVTVGALLILLLSLSRR